MKTGVQALPGIDVRVYSVQFSLGRLVAAAHPKRAQEGREQGTISLTIAVETDLAPGEISVYLPWVDGAQGQNVQYIRMAAVGGAKAIREWFVRSQSFTDPDDLGGEDPGAPTPEPAAEVLSSEPAALTPH